MRNGFDLLASNYDSLANLVFGDAIKKAQCTFINEIEDNDQVLILGGGTGWIINELLKQKPSIQITFVDLSSAMIVEARNAVKSKYLNQIIFINGTYEDAINNTVYDIVFTPFYLDMFRQREVEKIIKRVSEKLTDSGKWFFTDFRITNSVGQQLLLKVMYLFFKVICRISANKLANFETAFRNVSFKKQGERSFYSGMIESSIYTR